MRKQRGSEIRWLPGRSDVGAHILPPSTPTARCVPSNTLQTCVFLRGTAWERRVLQSLLTNSQMEHSDTPRETQRPASLGSLNPCAFKSLSATPPSSAPQVLRAASRALRQYQWCHYSLSLTNRSVSGNPCSPFSISSISHQRMKASILMFLFTIKKELQLLF